MRVLPASYYDLEEISPLNTNMPLEVLAQYVDSYGSTIMRPFTQEVKEQMAKQPQVKPFPELPPRLLTPHGIAQLCAGHYENMMSAEEDLNHLDAKVAAQVKAAAVEQLKLDLKSIDEAQQAYLDEGKAKSQASAQQLYCQSWNAVGAILASGILLTSMAFALLYSTEQAAPLTQIEVLTQLSKPQPSSPSLGPNTAPPKSLIAQGDETLAQSLERMLDKGAELLAQEARFQELGGNSIMVATEAEAKYADLRYYEQVLLTSGVVPLEASSGAIARYYLPEGLQDADYYVESPSFDPAQVTYYHHVLDLKHLHSLRLRDDDKTVTERKLVAILRDSAAPQSKLN